jgi:hypothetical protein
VNEHFKDTDMAANTEDAVKALADKFAAAEKALAALAKAIAPSLASIRDGGHIGGIQCIQLTADGSVAVNEALGLVADLHQEWTKIAQEKGIDLPVIASGGR